MEPTGTARTNRRPPRIEVLVTIAASTLLGCDDLPGEIDGYGPVDALTARALAAGGTWRRIVTDPLDGQVLDVGRTRYRPTAAIADHVRARDRRCTVPGCPTSAYATSTELDHTQPWTPTPDQDGGRTAADNLGPLCRRHHRHKTAELLHVRQTRPGVFEWTTYLGRRYRTTPGHDATITPLDPRPTQPPEHIPF